MKLLRLDLLAFGPFTDAVLDLEKGSEGLHLVYGPNEAGKSSALRAVRQLLFGIPERTEDAFRHPYDKLRLGAKVRRGDGSTLEFLRRKGRINTLRGPDDKTVVEPQELARCLGAVDQGLFQTMFGIDHKTLVEGGKEIVRGGGQLGQVLFAAGAGIADLRTIQQRLGEEMEGLFKPQARNPRINKALQDLREAQSAVKQQQLSSEEWTHHDRALGEARRHKEEVEQTLRQRHGQQHRLTRVRDALPAIGRRKQLLAEREECRDVILLPADFGDAWRAALHELRHGEAQAQAAKRTLVQIDRRLAELDVPESLLAQAEQVEELHKRLGEYQKGQRDHADRLLQCKQLEHEAKEILRSLGRPANLTEAEALRLGVEEPLRIQDLGARQQALLGRQEVARQATDKLRGHLARLKQEWVGLEAPRDTAELRRTVRRVQKEGDLEEQRRVERDKLRQAEQQAAVALGRLSLWSGPLEELERLPVPAGETVDRCENQLKEVRSAADKLCERSREEETALGEVETQIRQLELQHEVPTEEDLARARRQREAGWGLVRRAWLEQQADGPEVRDYLKAHEPVRDLAEAYERDVGRADQVADRLRREAVHVARKAELLAARQRSLGQREQLRQQTREVEARQERIEQEWRSLWQPLGIEPLPPQEMRAWLRKQAELVRQAQALREQRERALRLEETIAAHRQQLGACLQKLGEAAVAPDETLALLLERSQETLDRFEGLQRRREQLQRELATREQELHEAEARARHADEDLQAWREQWGKAMARLGLEVEATPAEANAFLAAITQLFQKLHEADGFRRRIEGIERDARHFTSQVRALVERIAPELGKLAEEQAAEELNAALTRARTAAKEREGLLHQHEREAANLRQAEEAIVRARIRLDALCREADCADYEDLAQAEQRSHARRQLEKELHQVEAHLLALSAGASLEEFIADAEKIDADLLEPELRRLGDQIHELQAQVSLLDQTIGGEQKALSLMDGSSRAALEAEKAAHLEAQLRADLQQYVVLRLASAVLQEGIRRYRDKTQGSVLDRASRLFAALTVGSFEALQVDYNDQGEAVLIGVRGGGKEHVGVEGMSDGCCDQLYLALRLATLEAYLDGHEPIPFVVDDILLNFDNDRAVAALKAMAELSRRTQVIFFTHHEHLVEVAEATLPGDVLVTHRLVGRARELYT